MHATNAQHVRSLPVRLSVPVWLAAFLSPTAYLLSLMILSRLQVPDSVGRFAVLMFCLVPVVALLVCGTAVWRSGITFRWRVGGLVLTTLGMLLQCGILFVLIVAAIAVIIAPAVTTALRHL